MDRLSAAAARALAWLLERHANDGTATVSDGCKEVTIVYRKKATESHDGLKPVHRRLLQVLKAEPRSARTLCREAGYAISSLTLVRQGLSDLVSMTPPRARHTREGYSTL